MSLKNEIETYKKAVATNEGEVEIFDKIIFPNVIRKREIGLILDFIKRVNPQKVLDFGCGGGWLSKILSSKGYKVIGLDISKSLVMNANRINKQSDFLTADCEKLPFKDSSFDLIIGVAILHHLDINKALTECYRVLRKGGYILFMEPNAHNPLMAIGRKITQSSIHTEDEKPISPGCFKKELNKTGFRLDSLIYLFPYSFCISYLLSSSKFKTIKFVQPLSTLIKYSEVMFEKIPLLNRFSGVIVAVAEKGKK